MDLNFLVGELFEDDIRQTIAAYETRCLDRLAKVVENDNFAVVSSQSLGRFLWVSGCALSNLLRANEGCRLLIRAFLFDGSNLRFKKFRH